LCASNLQWQTWQLDIVLPQPYWCCLFSSHISKNTTTVLKTHKIYSVQDIIFSTIHTPLEPTSGKCGGSRHPRLLQGSTV
jgi:hypothetical protein